MKLSKYTVFYDNYPTPGEYLALNTRTQSVVVLNQQLKDLLDRLPGNGNGKVQNKVAEGFSLPSPTGLEPADGNINASVTSPDNGNLKVSSTTVAKTNPKTLFSPEEQALLDQLKELGMVLEDDVDELRVLKHWFDQLKYTSPTMTATILTTFQCNLACTYCFEEGVDKHQNMNEQTTKEVISWLKHQVATKRPDTLKLVFYGGEPLLNAVPIYEIGEEMYRWCKNARVKFSFGIITNGTMLNPVMIEEFTKLGLTSIRITLDGPPKEHNKNRPFRNGHGSFDLIIKNIHGVIDKVQVDLGGNFNRENLGSFYRLLDILENNGFKEKLGPMLFAPIIARIGADNKSIDMTGCTSLSHDLMEEGLKLRWEVIRRGFKVTPGMNITTCPMSRDNAMVVIAPNGDIYKCAAFVGRTDFVVGNVRDEQLNYRAIKFMTMHSALEEDKCLDCAYLPMCGGGCRFSSHLEHQDYNQITCDKEYYEKIFPEILKMEYERGAL